MSLREHACVSSRGAQSTELVSLYIGYWTLNNYYYYYYYCCVAAVVKIVCLALEYVCIGDVTEDVFYVCTVRRGTVGALVSVPQCCIFHDVQFVNAGRGCKRRSHDCLVGSHECLFLFTPSCCGESFYYLCACTDML